MKKYEDACYVIRWHERCDECPIRANCLEEDCYELSDSQIEAIKDFADKVEDDAYRESMTEEERRWQADADYWNDRRCDPEDY